MSLNYYSILLVFSITSICFFIGKYKIIQLSKNLSYKAKSLPKYYGYWLATIALLTCVFIIIIDYLLNIISSKQLIHLLIALLIFFTTMYKAINSINSNFNARYNLEKIIKKLFLLATILTSATTIFVISSIAIESLHFFKHIPILDFLTGTIWDPQELTVKDNPAEHFGVIPVICGTLLITFISILIAVPIGLLSAIFLTEYATNNFRNYIKPILEILACIPTVVYGYFAALTIGPMIRNIAQWLGVSTSSESALAAGLVMGIMIIPFILSVSDDVINSIPQNLRDASFALGATKAETCLKIVVPAAMPGITAGILLAISRAIGETMIVTMAAGLNANLTINPLDSVTTVTAQIVNLLVGDQEFTSIKTLSAFALGLILFIITLILNIFAMFIMKKKLYISN